MAEAHWYVIHTYSGYENKVKANIDKAIENRHLEEQILEVRVPMQDIVEIKNGPRNRELCEKTKALLDGYRGNVCIESFNPLIVAWFRVHARHLVRGQLATSLSDYTRDGQPAAAGFVLHNTLLNFLSRPQFIAYRIGRHPPLVRLCTALGALNIGWTSHEPRSEQTHDAVIFEFYRPRQRYL